MIAAASFLAVLAVSEAALAQEQPRLESKSIPEFVRQLGSASFREREAATTALLARDDAIPQLRRALETANPEAKRRANTIILALTQRSLPRYVEYGRQGRIDVLVELLAVCPESLDTHLCWQATHDIARDLVKRANLLHLFENEDLLVQTAFETRRTSKFVHFLVDSDDESSSQTGSPAWWARKDDCYSRGQRPYSHPLATRCVITSAGAVTLEYSKRSFVFANGDVNIHFPLKSVIVTDGSIASKSSSSDVLIARKDVIVRGRVLLPVRDQISASHISAGGRVRIENIGKEWVSETVIKEQQSEPLGVRFFETSDVGIEVSATKDGIKVEKLTTGLPPAKAGLRTGDVILTVDRKKTSDAETFRRQLRRAFVQDEATISVQRGNQTIELTIPFYGFDLLKAK